MPKIYTSGAAVFCGVCQKEVKNAEFVEIKCRKCYNIIIVADGLNLGEQMIYTVTFNPAIDYVVRCGDFVQGAVNRTQSEDIFIGGKGINVSLVLAQLGIKSCAIGFTAGFTGEAIENGLLRADIITDFIRVKKGFSRINIKLKADVETEINGQGPEISAEELSQLFDKLSRLQSGDALVLAGSVPKSLPDDIYQQIMAQLSGRGIRIAADASGRLLTNLLQYRPWLIKPNHIELAELFGGKPLSDDEIVECCFKLQRQGAMNVLVSMAERGCILVTEDGGVLRQRTCTGSVKNSVGAGDSMVAGFIAGIEKGYEYALRLGTACGAATAFADGLGRKEDIERLLVQLQ